MFVRLLPWDYGVRNLMRRPSRSLLTLAAMTMVILVVLVVVGFLRGLEASLAVSGDPEVVLVYSLGTEENIENSSISTSVPGLLAASLRNVRKRYGQPYVSGELYLGTQISLPGAAKPSMGLLRGVTPAAALVRRSVRLTEGRWPESGEILVGKLAAAKLGFPPETVEIGRELQFEGKLWKIVGRFAAGGAAFESEIWCDQVHLQQTLKRDDLSLAAVMLPRGASTKEVELFCKERIDLELQAVPEARYYESLQRFYQPIRGLAWFVVLLTAGSGVFAGFNTMYGAVVGRVREIAALQAIGFRRRAILLSLVQEATVLSAAASLLASCFALLLLQGAAVRFTMGAFTLRIDGGAILVGCGVGFSLGILGALPAAYRALRLPVAESLKAT